MPLLDDLLTAYDTFEEDEPLYGNAMFPYVDAARTYPETTDPRLAPLEGRLSEADRFSSGADLGRVLARSGVDPVTRAGLAIPMGVVASGYEAAKASAPGRAVLSGLADLTGDEQWRPDHTTSAAKPSNVGALLAGYARGAFEPDYEALGAVSDWMDRGQTQLRQVAEAFARWRSKR